MNDLVFKDKTTNIPKVNLKPSKNELNILSKSEKLQKKVTRIKITNNFKKLKSKDESTYRFLNKQISHSNKDLNKDFVGEKIKAKINKEIENKNIVEKTKDNILKRSISNISVETQNESNKLLSKLDSNFLQNLIKLQSNPIFSSLPRFLSITNDNILPNSINTSSNDISYSISKNNNSKVSRMTTIIEKVNQDQIKNVFRSEIIDDSKIKYLNTHLL